MKMKSATLPDVDKGKKQFFLKPIHVLGALLLAGVLTLVLFTSSVTGASGTKTTTTVKPARPSAILPSQASFPGYQHIPFSGFGIDVSLANVAPNGKFILEVFSETLTIPQMKVEYLRFLRKYHDPGTKYLTNFATVLGCTSKTC
jgi:hypothetical protein